MKIGPVQNVRLPEQSGPVNQSRLREADGSFQKGDSVDISDEARRKLARTADSLLKLEQAPSPVYKRSDIVGRNVDKEPTATDESRAEILQEIRDRMETDYYDREEIVRKIADRLSDEIEGNE